MYLGVILSVRTKKDNIKNEDIWREANTDDNLLQKETTIKDGMAGNEDDKHGGGL